MPPLVRNRTNYYITEKNESQRLSSQIIYKIDAKIRPDIYFTLTTFVLIPQFLS